jgi:hypothetical protein
MEDTSTTRTQLKMKVLRCYGTTKYFAPEVLSSQLCQTVTCWTGWRNMIREVSLVRAARVFYASILDEGNGDRGILWRGE